LNFKNRKKFKELSSKNDADSILRLGIGYLNGLWGFKNKKLGMHFVDKSVEMGYTEAENKKGVILYNMGKHKEALQWFEKSAKNGLAQGMLYAGESYYFGEGALVNKKKAFYWFKKAAELDDVDGQNNIGICYFHGEGIKKDRKSAAKWIKKSYEGGHTKAASFWKKNSLWEYDEEKS